MDTLPLAYTVEQACEVASVGKTSLYQAIKMGILPAKKRGRRTLILQADLRSWLEQLPTLELGPKPSPAESR
jgi:excisionase family DNA binding protein